uniref:BTB domain-containing protein n=1 Tax=Daphnia galeata TaxID=27404 RepID=A0A8J2RDZ9_9CRUS|nr:unnamed protein product [Daphnia galeata]
MDLTKWTVLSLLDNKFLRNLKMAVIFGNMGSEVIMVTTDDDVYAMGCNSSGCLGLGDTTSALQPRKIESLCKKKIKGLAYGSGLHLLAFSDSGELYTWGYNTYSQLGNGNTNHTLSPSLVGGVLAGKTVIQVGCGNHHCLALTNEGEVFAWGQNNGGQCGSGTTTGQSVPRRVTSGIGGHKVVAIACGQLTSMALLDDGDLYGWGYNGNGELGIGNNNNQHNPVRVSNLNKVFVTQIVCGFAHCLALTDQGEIYAWGANSYGQLGTGYKTHHLSPVIVNSELGKAVEIAACHLSHISAAMFHDGKIFMWGHCRGHSIFSPSLTPYTHLDEVFACYSTPAVTWRTLQFRARQDTPLAETLRLAFNDENTGDLCFKVAGNSIWVHKAILRIRCQYYRAMFQHNTWAEADQETVEIEQFSYPVYYCFLKYLYTDEVDLPVDEALGLLDLANAYCETELKSRCQHLIRQSVNTENVAVLFATGLKYEAQDLEEYCLRFAVHHLTAVVQTETFSKLEEATMKHFISRVARMGAFRY